MAKKKSQINERIMLACTECKERNYATTKNKRNNPERIELSKFCSRCGKRTPHKETK
ncbi:MAG: 50S ribosomal protein L33 [Clostridia bacterium]|jgi:large subunit ribosomal protein L33|nr:50S ribosomal protein L33 [Clostridia bacterium]MDD3232389.1 50S ribosomal protein L33 [Clostridia bacterium]MDD3862346.1 50S ribosomal protein L33 [Clostridia bacterium]MDD4408300.1 50S ribosomal protein L33 [Clostridia bacterium]